ncbi:MAG: hypothetical protein ABFC84_16555 [Veillonellales bacterium]
MPNLLEGLNDNKRQAVTSDSTLVKRYRFSVSTGMPDSEINEIVTVSGNTSDRELEKMFDGWVQDQLIVECRFLEEISTTKAGD